MKTLFKILSTVALALVLFVPAKVAFSDGFPAGVSFRHVVGAVLDPTGATETEFTTLDAINFGFRTSYVRICLRPESETSYFRFATTAFIGSVQAHTTPDLWELSTSANFIAGSASTDWGALPMTAGVSDGLEVVGSSAPVVPVCITQPWAVRGILMHIASGTATADVWGYK